MLSRGGKRPAVRRINFARHIRNRLIFHHLFNQISFDFIQANAGFVQDKTLRKMTDEQWDRSLAVNLSAPFRLIRAAIPALLEAEGASLSNIVKTTVLLDSIDDYAAMNTAYTESLGDHRPARAAFAVDALPLGGLVEIEAIAVVD